MVYAEFIGASRGRKGGTGEWYVDLEHPLSSTDRLHRATLLSQFRPISLLKLCREFATLIR